METGAAALAAPAATAPWYKAGGGLSSGGESDAAPLRRAVVVDRADLAAKGCGSGTAKAAAEDPANKHNKRVVLDNMMERARIYLVASRQDERFAW